MAPYLQENGFKLFFDDEFWATDVISGSAGNFTYTVDPRKSNGLILEKLETRTKSLRKIRFETRIKIRK
jgi:hypothetical protein